MTGKKSGRPKGLKNRPKGEGTWWQCRWYPNLEVLPDEAREMPVTILDSEDFRLNRAMRSRYKDPVFKKSENGIKYAYRRRVPSALGQQPPHLQDADTEDESKSGLPPAHTEGS